jgi:hypothetical protein
VHVHRPTALPYFEDECIGGDEGVGPGVQRSTAEGFYLAVEVLGHLADLGPAQPGDAEGFDQLLHPSCRDAEQVAGRHHRHEGGLGPSTPLQQPVREVASLPQLRDRQIDRPGAGVPPAAPVTVAGVSSVRVSLTVTGAAHRIGVCRHQRLGECLQHGPKKIRACLR